jgi:The GLUG motif
LLGMAGCDQSTTVEIHDWYDLDAVRDDLGGSYVLMNSLDSTTSGYEELAAPEANGGKGWQPIASSNEIFVGTFDGRGYEICDLFINRRDEYNVGLFGAVYFGGSIANLGVVNATVNGYMWVGAMAGGNVGTVSNSYSAASVNGTQYVGGLMGSNGDGGTVSNSYSTGRVSGNWSVGGMAGNNAGTVGDCHATANVRGEGGVGGLVGSNAGTVSNSYSTGSVTGDRLAGGLMGVSSGDVTNSYSTGSVTGREDVGGLVGYIGGSVINSYSTGNVTGQIQTGGLVGADDGGTVINSFWDMETSGQSTSAGGTGRTTAEMQDISTFTGASWDIVTVPTAGYRDTGYTWNIVDHATYPFLSWQAI